MIAADTSVVVAAFASWHEGHASALGALSRRPRLPAHVLVETYSVLTRLPVPYRAPAVLVAEFLAARFPEPALLLDGAGHLTLLARAADAGISGGAIHDALIAATAQAAGAKLLTRDQRALAIYERMGVDYEVLD